MLTRQTISYCGRPLGIRRHNAEQFIVADAVLGIVAVNFDKGHNPYKQSFTHASSGTREVLLPASMLVEGKPMKFPDDFDFVDNDTIVFSDASTRFGYSDFLMAFLEHIGDGRLFSEATVL